jgi:hypothetical protein
VGFIDPSETAPDVPTDGKVGRENHVPSGVYLIALVWFRYRTGRRRGGEYMATRYEVVDGPHHGDAFWGSMGIDTSQRGTRTRWLAFARAVGVTSKFDPELGEEVGPLFLLEPFRARVSLERRNSRPRNEIVRYFFPPHDQATEATIEAWRRDKLAEWSERGIKRSEWSGRPHELEGGGGPSDDDGWPTDDDIPF